MIELRFKRRATGGAAGAPASLLTAEPAYNMTDGKLYIGYGDDGSGNATSIKAFGADNFWMNIPSDGGTGDILTRTAGGVAWSAAPEGSIYGADGNGIELTGSTFSLNYGEIATGLALATTYAPISHTHGDADITGLDASKLTGTIDAARLPTGVLQAPIVSSGAIAALTAPQQADIVEGTTVVTSDGRMWMYSGSGSKTLEASYIELADKTPDWSAIANKPAFATVATSGAYNDLSGKPSLGTMASQNADNVSITGGSISGVTLDGGTF